MISLTNFSQTLYNLNLLSTIQVLRSSSFILTRKHCHARLQPTSHGHIDECLHHLLQSCTNAQTLNAIRSLHAIVITIGSYARQPIFFNNNVICLYASFGELSTARKVFDKMSQKNTVSFNTLVSAYSREGHVELAWEMFRGMWGCGFAPTQASFSSLFSCATLDMDRGCMLHALILKNGLFYSDPYAGTALLGLFGRHGFVDEAIRIFEALPKKSLITWNSIISLLVCHGFVVESLALFRELMSSNYSFSGTTLVSLLAGFTGEEDLELGGQLHGLAIKNCFDIEFSVLNTLLNMYVKCLDDGLSEKLFEEMPFRDVVSYNIMIGRIAKGERLERALMLLLNMSIDRVFPNQTTYVRVINSCATFRIPTYGEYVHAKVIRNAFQHDVFVGSSLVDFYGKCGILDAACRCFDEIYDKNVVSWNALIAGCSTKCCTTSILLFQEMHQSGYSANEFTFSSVLRTPFVFELRQLHCLSIKMGYHNNEFVFSSLVISYAKNGLISDALIVAQSFEMPLPVVSSNVIAAIYNRSGQHEKSLEILSLLEEPDIVSWNVLLSACSHNGYYNEVFELFKHMLVAKVRCDNYTIVSVLSACTNLCSLALGSCVHGLLVKTNFEHCDTFVFNLLVDMYSKCGSIESSVKIFDEIADKNIITWTSLISALGHHGYGCEALERFGEMVLLGIEPDGVTFIAVLSACRHGGLVKEGMELFSHMENVYGVKPRMDHYLGVVDLLARYGHLKEAEQVIVSMPFPPNMLIWRSFLEGCKRQRTLPVGHIT